MTRRTLLPLLALAALLAVGGVAAWKVLSDPTVWPPDDYVEYWAAGRLNLHGQDPYSPELLLPLEQGAGRDTSEAVMMWNPPWTLTAVMPLGTLPARVGQLLWFALNLAAVSLSASLLWDVNGGPREKRWVAFAVAFTFIPTLFALHAGQISAVLLLGCSAFAWCAKRGYPFWAGAAAVLAAIKPHLVYLLWPAVAVDALATRRWRIVLGGIAAGVVATLIPMALNPHVWNQYSAAYRDHGPSEWVSLTPGVVLRLLFGEEKFWLQFVPMLAGVAWFAWHRRRNAGAWNWAEQLPAIVLVSFVTAPYGAWHFDLVLLLLPILHRAAKFMANRDREGAGGLTDGHPQGVPLRRAISVGAPLVGARFPSAPPAPSRSRFARDKTAWFALAALVLANVTMYALSRCNVWSFWYCWVAPLTLVVYAATSPRKAAAPALSPAAVPA